MLWHWLLHVTGTDNVSGKWYGFWSGFGSDIAELAIIGAVYGALRKHMCHQGRCWRVGRHLVEGTPWCNRHHAAARTPKPRTPLDPVLGELRGLRGDVSGLAQAIRAAVGPVRAGAGSNPAMSEGLPAESAERLVPAAPVVPPAAATRRNTTSTKGTR